MTKKGKFLQKINEAFANNDTEYIIENVTDDIRWTAPGDFKVQGKDEFIRTMKKMVTEEAYELDISNIITHGNTAAIDGTMKMTNGDEKGKTYAFCDVYKLSGFKNPKIKEMTSYVIENKR